MIEGSADSELARMLAPGTPARLFVASEGVDYPASRAGRWNAEATPATADDVLALAGLLGVSGAFPSTTLPFDDANAGRCADGTTPSTPSAPTDSVVEAPVAELMEAIGVGGDSYRTETFPLAVLSPRVVFGLPILTVAA